MQSFSRLLVVSRTEIRIAGFGGQGIILAGIVLGQAAIHERKKAVQTQSYGAETRGGAARSEVVISNEMIDYPKVISADIAIMMSQESFKKYGSDVKPGGSLFVDADLVTDVSAAVGPAVYRIPATRLSTDEFKKRLVANMVMLGAVAAVTKCVQLGSLRLSLRDVAPNESVDLNTRALQRGFEWARENLAIQSK
jgi:2-oxoglutarate ferredoxin oxidoreductase subunit gamma